MRYWLEIELLSAASPGSGEGWAGLIDSDIVFDEFGLPYIPARRIKGIVREMADDVVAAFQRCLLGPSPFDSEAVSKLFGEQGQCTAAAIGFNNAYPEGYDELKVWMQWARELAPYLAAPENVVAIFTQVRAQTEINEEKGIAKDHSLRLTRVIAKGHKFIATVEFGHADEGLKNLLALAVGVTRSLGGKRNRGLGKIKCKLKDENGNPIGVLNDYRKFLGTETGHE